MSSRRVSLPGADELFRSTSPLVAGATAPAVAPVPEPEPAEPPRPAERPVPAFDDSAAPEPAAVGTSPVPVRRRPRPAADRRPTGREKHDEKITVYVSPEELLDLERARLTLRSEYGLAVDRGRIVREALALVLGDLDAKGDSSVLVRRLRGR